MSSPGKRTEFSGSIPELYDRHLGPALFDPYALDLTERLPVCEGLRVLETACGTGVVTRRLREALDDSATLVATDLNQPMVDYAQAAVAADGIVWQQADAQALPFDDESFDVVVCQFGVMFLPDKVQGFREARRVLAPDGLLLVNVWQSAEDNPPTSAIQAALEEFFPDDPPRFLDTPFGYHDHGRIRADLAAAGWEEVQLDDVRVQSSSPTAADFATGYGLGTPLTHDLIARDADLDAVVDVLAEALALVGGERPFTAELAAIVITGVR